MIDSATANFAGRWGERRRAQIKRIAILLVAGAAIAASMTGCAGSESDANVNFGAFAGNYNAAFVRGTGTITLTVDSTGKVDLVLSDSDLGVFQGSGSANHVGGFFITCTGKNGKTITVNGTLRGSGLGRTAAGTVAGSIALPFTANLSSAPDATLWVNHYEGLWKLGPDSGNWYFDVDASGAATGLILLPSGNVNLAGQVFSNGSVSLTDTGGAKTYQLQGALRLSPPSSVLGAGLYKFTTGGATQVGDWEVHNGTPG